MEDKCYCLEVFKKKYGDYVQGKCLEWSCGRYRIEQRKIKENKLIKENKNESNGR